VDSSELVEALCLCVRAKWSEAVSYLLRAGAEANGYLGECTVLQVAVEVGNEEALRLLLAAKANPNQNSRSNRLSTLGAAASQGDAWLVKLLL
jgi:ankyrin repeat protein